MGAACTRNHAISRTSKPNVVKIHAKFSDVASPKKFEKKGTSSSRTPHMSTKFSSSKLVKDGEFKQSSNNVGQFEQISEVRESCFSSVNNSRCIGTQGNRNSIQEGYEMQEAEYIGEGELTTVYKTNTGESKMPIIFKVFKFNNITPEHKKKYAEQLSNIIAKIQNSLPSFSGLGRYYDVDEDNATKDIVLIMEYIASRNLKAHIEAFGVLDIDTIKVITLRTLMVLRNLSKIGCYHGRLNISNVHVDDICRVKLSDYSYMSIIDSESDFTPEEGSRLDIFCLGIMILKMLGKVKINEGNDANNDAYYLENMPTIKNEYRNDSSNRISSSTKDFLDNCFEKIVTIQDLIDHPFLRYYENGKEINRKFSTKETSNTPVDESTFHSKKQTKLSIFECNDESSASENAHLSGLIEGSVVKTSKSSEPIEMESNDQSQSNAFTNSVEDYETTLREFEISLLNQRQKKPRTSNFIGSFDFYTQSNTNLSICNSTKNGQMNTIQEDDQSSRSNDDECNESNSANAHSVNNLKNNIDLSDSQ